MRVLALRYNVTEVTLRNWKLGTEFNDQSPTAQRLQATFTPAQEAIGVYQRTTLLLPLDDLVPVTCEFQLHGLENLIPAVARFELDRCWRCHGVGFYREPAATRGEDAFQGRQGLRAGLSPHERHWERARHSKCLLPIADKDRRSCVIVAPWATIRASIDRGTCWVLIAFTPNKTAVRAQAFFKAPHKADPIKITPLNTDGKNKIAWSDIGPGSGSGRDEPQGRGEQFTDRLFGSRSQGPSGQHEFGQLSQALGIKHRLKAPRSPPPFSVSKGDGLEPGPQGEPRGRGEQSNGKVQRFKGRIADPFDYAYGKILETHHFDSALDLEQTLHGYVPLYNSHLPLIGARQQYPDPKHEGLV